MTLGFCCLGTWLCKQNYIFLFNPIRILYSRGPPVTGTFSCGTYPRTHRPVPTPLWVPGSLLSGRRIPVILDTGKETAWRQNYLLQDFIHSFPSLSLETTITTKTWSCRVSGPRLDDPFLLRSPTVTEKGRSTRREVPISRRRLWTLLRVFLSRRRRWYGRSNY